MAELEIIRVENASLLNAFIDLPWQIYQDAPNWVPPLKKELRKLLTPNKHPFWEFSERILLLARRGSEPVGRLAGIIDCNYNRYHHAHTGIWGFFECRNDRDAAQALFSEVESWLASKGMNRVVGPFNPSTNYEVGMLIQGFEHKATFMMPYNPPYYPWLLESRGYRKEKDLLSFVVGKDWQLTEWIQKLADRLKRSGNFTVRPADKSRFTEELLLIKEVYEDCWSDNWGFVPMTDGEFEEMGRNLRLILDYDLVFIIEYKGRPVGIAVIVPDINPLLQRFNGKFGLLGVAKYLMYKKEVEGLRGLLFGVRKEYRKLGVPFLALEYLYHALKERPHYRYLELGWNLEDNEEINELEHECGARLFKKYRVFGKNLPVAP